MTLSPFLMSWAAKIPSSSVVETSLMTGDLAIVHFPSEASISSLLSSAFSITQPTSPKGSGEVDEQREKLG